MCSYFLLGRRCRGLSTAPCSASLLHRQSQGTSRYDQAGATLRYKTQVPMTQWAKPFPWIAETHASIVCPCPWWSLSTNGATAISIQWDLPSVPQNVQHLWFCTWQFTTPRYIFVLKICKTWISSKRSSSKRSLFCHSGLSNTQKKKI